MDLPTVLSPATWRVIKMPPANGAWNMAVDEAILMTAARGDSPPTLRFYAWDPPCLSLGYAQPVSDVDLERLSSCGWDLVRRPTGGRAILHTDELTYAVIGPAGEPRLAGSIPESYKRLAGGLQKALERLALPVQSQSPEENLATQANRFEPVCFEVPGNYEITVHGKKLVGSAQARKYGGVLQHGTLPLHGDLTRITQALAYPDPQARASAAARLRDRATTVTEGLGRPVGWEAAAEAICEAFKEVLNLDLVPGTLTETERQTAAELVAQKYGNPDWNKKGN